MVVFTGCGRFRPKAGENGGRMRQIALIALKCAVSAALLYLAVSRIDLGSLGAKLSRLEPSWIALAIVVGVAQIALIAIRWQRITAACGAQLSFQDSCRFNLIAAFFGQVLPSTVGGDAARIWLLARRGAGWRAASYSVLLDRFFGVLALAVVVTGGLYWSFELIENPVGRLVLLLIGLGSLAGGLGFLIFGRWRILKQWKLTAPISDMAVLAGRLVKPSEGGLLIAATSLIVHFMTAAIAWSIAHAVAAQLSYADACLLVLPVMLIATVPISIAGWGVRESALMLAFSYAGLQQGDGLVISVLLGLVTLAVGLLGGLAWLAMPQAPSIGSALKAEQPQ